MEITFESLPKAVTQLCEDMAILKRHILEKSIEQPTEADRWFDLNELLNYLPDKPAKATVYGWVHDGLIPCHKGAKKLRFLKSEIDQWLLKGKRKTLSELEAEADQYLKSKKKK
jgi:predicted DNA-binding transcriptional regulator AlpA